MNGADSSSGRTICTKEEATAYADIYIATCTSGQRGRAARFSGLRMRAWKGAGEGTTHAKTGWFTRLTPLVHGRGERENNVRKKRGGHCLPYLKMAYRSEMSQEIVPQSYSICVCSCLIHLAIDHNSPLSCLPSQRQTHSLQNTEGAGYCHSAKHRAVEFPCTVPAVACSLDVGAWRGNLKLAIYGIYLVSRYCR